MVDGGFGNILILRDRKNQNKNTVEMRPKYTLYPNFIIISLACNELHKRQSLLLKPLFLSSENHKMNIFMLNLKLIVFTQHIYSAKAKNNAQNKNGEAEKALLVLSYRFT